MLPPLNSDGMNTNNGKVWLIILLHSFLNFFSARTNFLSMRSVLNSDLKQFRNKQSWFCPQHYLEGFIVHMLAI